MQGFKLIRNNHGVCEKNLVRNYFLPPQIQISSWQFENWVQESVTNEKTSL